MQKQDLPNEESPNEDDGGQQNENVEAAHEQAEQDIQEDPELSADEDPEADLDEGELARLDNNNDEADI